MRYTVLAVCVIVMFVVAAITFVMLGIWTGDERWGQTGTVFGILSIVSIMIIPAALILEDK